MTTAFDLPPNLTRHPLSACFPDMLAGEFDELVLDIEKIGQRELVVLLDDQILDGWHRYQACTKLGVTCVGRDFQQDGDAVAYVTSKNLRRRSLTPSQRASVTVALYNWASTPVGLDGRSAPGETKTNQEMADLADVSRRTIQRAKDAEAAGLADKVIAGEMTVTDVEKAGERALRPSKPKDTLISRYSAKVDAAQGMIDDLERQVQERDLRLEVAIEELEQYRHRDLPESELSTRCDQLLREMNTYKARLNEEMEKTAALTRELNYLKKELSRR